MNGMKIFNETVINENSMPYFVLLSNLQKVIHMSLNEIVLESEEGKISTLPVSSFQSVIFRLLVKAIEPKNEKDSLIQNYGFSVLGSKQQRRSSRTGETR